MCDCKYFDGDGCTYHDYANGKTEDGYCGHGDPVYDEEGNETEEVVECDEFTEGEFEDEEE